MEVLNIGLFIVGEFRDDGENLLVFVEVFIVVLLFEKKIVLKLGYGR